MPQNVIMPQMGESIAEGTVTTWLKKVGDKINRDEPLFEISTDKVDAEIPSPTSGVLLEIKVQPGQTVPINTVVAVVGEAGESAAAAATPDPKPVETKPAPTAVQPAVAPKGNAPVIAKVPDMAPQKSNGTHAAPAFSSSLEERRRTKSSPVVRKIAGEHGVDISQISGSGISGRVTKSDILGFLDKGGARAVPAPTPTMPGKTTTLAGSGDVMTRGPVPEAYRPKMYDGDRIEDMSMMRAKIAEHMVLSKRISPHVATVWDVDFSRVAALRNKHKGSYEQNHGVKLTYTGFIIKATVDALKAFPIINASLDENKVIYHRDIHLGIAVALDWGLIVPVVHNAGELNLLGLMRRATDLAERSRTKKLKPDEVQGGTFTITNPGVFGPLFGLPVINQPQVAILGVGGIEKRPVVISDENGDSIGIRTKAYMSLSFDHRLIDGAVADQFMARLKKNIEEFDESAL